MQPFLPDAQMCCLRGRLPSALPQWCVLPPRHCFRCCRVHARPAGLPSWTLRADDRVWRGQMAGAVTLAATVHTGYSVVGQATDLQQSSAPQNPCQAFSTAGSHCASYCVRTATHCPFPRFWTPPFGPIFRPDPVIRAQYSGASTTDALPRGNGK